jgi:hypothetical protein
VITTLHIPDHLRLGCECKPPEPMLAKEQRHRVKAERRAIPCTGQETVPKG